MKEGGDEKGREDERTFYTCRCHNALNDLKSDSSSSVGNVMYL